MPVVSLLHNTHGFTTAQHTHKLINTEVRLLTVHYFPGLALDVQVKWTFTAKKETNKLLQTLLR